MMNRPGFPVLALLLVPVLGGCSAFRMAERSQDVVGLRTTGAPEVPPEPEPAPEHLELRRGAADLVARALRQQVNAEAAEGNGENAEDGNGEQLARVAEAVSGDLGKPAHPWPLPAGGASARTRGIDARLDDYARERRRYEGVRAAWLAEIERLSRRPTERTTRLWSGLAWLYVAFGVGGAGALLAAVARWGAKGWKIARQLIPGIQRFLDASGESADPARAQDLKNELSAATDRDVKAAIDLIKRKTGLK